MYFLKIFKKIKFFVLSVLNNGTAQVHTYNNYNDYVAYQKLKTTDPARVQRLIGVEWDIKLNGFKDIFQRNWEHIKDKKNAICLGARTGQEVKALRDMGIPAIGVDLVPFEPYTVEGDIHALRYSDNAFDFVFTNIFDHSLYPDKFCSEMERIAQHAGVIVIHMKLGIELDQYTETFVFDAKNVVKMFKQIEVVASRRIKNSFDEMNWELILRKK